MKSQRHNVYNQSAPGNYGGWGTLDSKGKSLEFKYLYFTIQGLINKKVVLSLKYEQLKTPSIHSSLVKPLTKKIIEKASCSNLRLKLGKIQGIHQGLKWAAPTSNFYTSDLKDQEKLSMNLIFILLLLRYEFLTQSENDLIKYEILNSKATICEVLAIRMLREYKSISRINLLFVSPLEDDFMGNVRSAVISKTYNTLEVAVLAKSKKFLSQPIIEQILDKFYNGDLVLKKKNSTVNSTILLSLMEQNYNLEEQKNMIPEENSGNIINYKFTGLCYDKVLTRSNVVPKYQSIVINMKIFFLSLLHITLVLKNRNVKLHIHKLNIMYAVAEIFYWLMALNFNFEFILKLVHLEKKFLRKIVWTYTDFLLTALIDWAFILRIYGFFNAKVMTSYYDFFSLVSILLLPRMLSIFNNYEFFNLITLSFKKMSWKFFGLFCLFLCLISGFYLTFISLSSNITTPDIAFDMLKIFFGFTPSVWSNWDNYNNLGRVVLMAYLFLIQFIISTILAIVLSQAFSRLHQTNKEEFCYFKATNLIIYFHSSNLLYRIPQYISGKGSQSLILINRVGSVFRYPIVLVLFFYELLIANFRKGRKPKDLKAFTVLNKEVDYYPDRDLMFIINEDETEASVVGNRTRQSSNAYYQNGRILSKRDHAHVMSNNLFNNLVPMQSLGTIGNFRSMSADSLFLEDVSKDLRKNSISYSPGLGPTITNPEVEKNSDYKATAGNRQLLGQISNVSMCPTNPNSLAGKPVPYKKNRKKKAKKKEIIDKLTHIEVMIEQLANEPGLGTAIHGVDIYAGGQANDEASKLQDEASSVVRSSQLIPRMNAIYKINEGSYSATDLIDSMTEIENDDDEFDDTNDEIYETVHDIEENANFIGKSSSKDVNLIFSPEHEDQASSNDSDVLSDHSF